MKSKQEIKEELHKLIDSIDDEHVLNVLNDEVLPYVIDNKISPAVDDELTPAQQKRLEEAINQSDEGRVITLDEFYNRMEKWNIK